MKLPAPIVDELHRLVEHLDPETKVFAAEVFLAEVLVLHQDEEGELQKKLRQMLGAVLLNAAAKIVASQC